MTNETKPVAWRVKDYADGWTVHRYEHEAHRAARNGNLIEPLYTRAPINRPSPEVGESALVERLRVMAGADGRITCMAEYNGGAVASSQSIAAALCADAADTITRLASAKWWADQLEVPYICDRHGELGEPHPVQGCDRCSHPVQATITRLQAELAEARKERDELRWAIMGGEDAPGVLDTVTHEEVLEALQESRSNWKSYAEMVAAECNRLSAALGEAERAINRAKEAVEDQDDIELVGSLDAALSTLKTAREG